VGGEAGGVGEVGVGVGEAGSSPGRTTGGGYGVLGVRERVAAYGGTVRLRPGPDGGAVLSARIPVPS